jgi:epoxyqueuosine reductase
MDVKLWLTREATALGFDLCRVTSAAQTFDQPLETWLAYGHHGTMDWMTENRGRRASPQGLWPEARSVIMLGMNYGPEDDPLATLAQPEVGTISVYARHRDYHDVIKGRLKELAQKLAARTDHQVKVFVDTAPLMEKPLAQAAGLGWQGKHSVLVSRELGNWLFLGAIVTTLDLRPDGAETDHCGTCRRCLTACPTDAFPAPYVLDSRRCISYLTIEHKGPIEAKLQAREDLKAPPLVELLALDDAAFRKKFTGSPIKRTGRDRFIRNVLIAAGNASSSLPLAGRVASASEPGGGGIKTLLTATLPHLADHNPVVRGAAIWAISRLDPERASALKHDHLATEADASVREEWEAIV